jgi:hypothetical protein
MLFFGALRRRLIEGDPPTDMFSNRMTMLKTEATVQCLVKVGRLKPSQIAVFAQQDAYGTRFAGVARAIRSLEATTAKFCGSITSATPE